VDEDEAGKGLGDAGLDGAGAANTVLKIFSIGFEASGRAVSTRSRIRSSVCLAAQTVGLKDVTDGAALCSTLKVL
jgi:hypothetical protein